MKLSELKSFLSTGGDLSVLEPNNMLVPAHFHITEAGLTTKHFIDCGGTIRQEHYVSFQMWVADDTDHRLTAEKMVGIIEKADALFKGMDPEVEVEYQRETIGRFGLEVHGSNLRLTHKQTDCLAKDKCGIEPVEKAKVQLAELQPASPPCTPGSGCC